jgi:hypothetical protein
MQLPSDHDFTYNPHAPSRLRKNSRYLHENEEFQGGGGGGPSRYGPGGCLTEQTGSIPDTVQFSQRHVEAGHAMESEQCDGREATVCV